MRVNYDVYLRGIKHRVEVRGEICFSLLRFENSISKRVVFARSEYKSLLDELGVYDEKSIERKLNVPVEKIVWYLPRVKKPREHIKLWRDSLDEMFSGLGVKRNGGRLFFDMTKMSYNFMMFAASLYRYEYESPSCIRGWHDIYKNVDHRFLLSLGIMHRDMTDLSAEDPNTKSVHKALSSPSRAFYSSYERDHIFYNYKDWINKGPSGKYEDFSTIYKQ